MKEGRTYIHQLKTKWVVPGNGPNSFFKNCVMHPCNSNKNFNQLESDTFQGSVCASTQAKNYNLVLSDLVVDVSIYDSLVLLKKTQYARDTYWEDDFEFVNKDLLPLTRYDIIKVVDDSKLPPIEIYKKDNKWHYNNGRHRHLRLLVRNQCDPNFKLQEGEHFIVSFAAQGKEDILFKYTNNFHNNYYILDIYKKSLLEVHKSDFKRRDLPFIEYKDWKVKFIGKRSEALELIKKLRNKVFNQESLTQKYNNIKNQFTDFLGGLSTIFEVIAGIGRTSVNIKNKYESFKSTFINPTIDNNMFTTVKKYGLGLAKILVSICKIISEDGIQLLSFSSLILDIFSLVEDTNFFKSESLETILIAGVSTMLPTPLIDIIKKMSLLTSKKLFDDNGFIFEFFTLVSKALTYVISFFPKVAQDYLNSVLDLFGLTEFIFIYRAQKLLHTYFKNKHIILEDSFRNNVKTLRQDIKDIDLKKFFSKNKPLSEVAGEFERIYKSVISYEQTSRQEPCCFVFQGPPGCRKSVTVNKVIATLGLTHYSHIVKCSEDSKDWYDSYNNEDIFYMDDVGQMGKSQWRNLINWVSAVKLPLDCAEASLKDTKYFNSELILLTTNNFINLNGFTTKDCIDSPEALWRRGYVFDFEYVRGDGDNMTGEVTFKYYDIKSKQFRIDFPDDFKEFLLENNVDLQTHCNTEEQNTFLSWVTTIIMGFRELKRKQLNNNTLTNEDINLIRASNPFMQETRDLSSYWEDSYFSNKWESLPLTFNYAKLLLNSLVEHILDKMKSLLSDFIVLITSKPVFACCSLILGLLVSTLIYKCKENFKEEGAFLSTNSENIDKHVDWIDSFEKIDLNCVHSVIPKIVSQMFEIDIVCVEGLVTKVISCHSLVSGRHLIVPYHLVLDRELQIVIYKNRAKNHRIVDHSPVKVIYKNIENDVAIISLSEGFPTPFPKLASSFQPHVLGRPFGLVFPNKLIKLDGLTINSDQCGPIVYPIGKMMNKIVNPITYKDLHFPGMCGTLVITNQGSILGMHVAGHNVKSVGATLQWSPICRKEIFEVLDSRDNGLKIVNTINEKVIPDCSGFKIDTDLNVFVPKNTNFVKSPLFGVFEVSRQPANLSVYGPHTVKDVSKSSRSIIGPVDNNELAFAGKVLDLYFEDYTDLSEEVIVRGDDMLAPINKKSSNGIFPIKSKLDCFDFTNGKFKEDFSIIYKDFENKMMKGDVEAKDIAWAETLKDELRNVEKKEPRSFRVSPVTMQVLTKKCFGNMVKKIVKERWFNEIMIGLNPFSEWPKLYQRMQGGRCWGGDIGKYDKCMRVQVQELVAEKILQYYRGDYKQAARNVLLNISHNLVVVNDDSWILTHSLPSGCWLTAIFNSLVNRVYTAMWYYREMSANGYKPNYLNFHLDISDPVYGDDRLNRCINPLYQNFLNAITMEKFFNSLGMDMTDSLKGKIVTPFQPVEELTFLKRYFRFHPDLATVTCPLDLRTVYSTLSWIDTSKDDLDLVLRDKINAFQREIFLHFELYEDSIKRLETACIERNIPFSLLPKSYLIKLYNEGAYDENYSKAFGLLVN